MNAKELVKNALRGRKVPRPPFIPFVGSYLTRVDQLSLEDIYHDPGLLHQALKNTQQLLNYDAAVIPLDLTLEAEAFGLSTLWERGGPAIAGKLALEEAPPFDAQEWIKQGRLPVFIEAAKRYAQIDGKKVPLLASVSGPLTIWSQLYGSLPITVEGVLPSDIPHLEPIVQAVITLCRSYAEAGVDGIVINEGSISFRRGDSAYCTGIYKPIFNVIRHFNLLGVFRMPQQADGPSFSIPAIGADALIPSVNMSAFESGAKGAAGIALNKDFWSGELEDSRQIAEFSAASNSKVIFLTTELPLDQEDIDLFDLQEKIEQITADAFWNV